MSAATGRLRFYLTMGLPAGLEQQGDTDGLVDLLAANAAMYGDGGEQGAGTHDPAARWQWPGSCTASRAHPPGSHWST